MVTDCNYAIVSRKLPQCDYFMFPQPINFPWKKLIFGLRTNLLIMDDLPLFLWIITSGCQSVCPFSLLRSLDITFHNILQCLIHTDSGFLVLQIQDFTSYQFVKVWIPSLPITGKGIACIASLPVEKQRRSSYGDQHGIIRNTSDWLFYDYIKSSLDAV